MRQLRIGDSVMNGMFREGFTEKVIFEQSLEEGKGKSLKIIGGQCWRQRE